MSAERYAFAQSVARLAGALAHQYWRDRERLTVELKGPQDFVSHADRDVEALLRREIEAAFPDDAFLGEETAARSPDRLTAAGSSIRSTARTISCAAFRTGTSRSLTSSRAARRDRRACSIPVHDELFHARRGDGAWCDSG